MKDLLVFSYFAIWIAVTNLVLSRLGAFELRSWKSSLNIFKLFFLVNSFFLDGIRGRLGIFFAYQLCMIIGAIPFLMMVLGDAFPYWLFGM